MAKKTYLELVNSILIPLNEVPLDLSNFSTITSGVYAEAKEGINKGLRDIYVSKRVKWPFLYSTLTFSTERGIIDYTKPSTVLSVNWDTFRRIRQTNIVSSLTRSGNTVTVTTSSAHNAKTGDIVQIDGATPDGYNSASVSVTVTGANTFTYTVDDDTLTTPATGTITATSNTLLYTKLWYVDEIEYLKDYADTAENLTVDSYQAPETVSRTPSNDFKIFPASDRVYQISYNAYTVPDVLVNATDLHSIPEAYENAITEYGLYYVYMLRDNMEQAAIAKKKADDIVDMMIRVLTPFPLNATTP